MITTVPLPHLGTLFALPFLGHPPGPELAAPWLRAGDLGALWLSRSAWSVALAAEAATRAHERLPVIAIPEYFCNQSLWPLRQGRARLVFYPVDAGTLAPDWAAMDGLAADMLVLVHYFGRPNDAAGARAWCDARGALLVEDAAHVLAPIAGIGEQGDLVLYSPHKLLAVPDGAPLVLRPGAQALAPHLLDALGSMGGAHPSTRGWWLKRLAQKSPLGPLLTRRRFGGQPDFLVDPPPRPLPPTPLPSPTSAALLARPDLAMVAQRRRANWDALARAVVAPHRWAPLFPTCNDFVPYRLVMQCADTAAAAEAYARLRAAGLPVESWPDLPPEAGEAARALRRHLVFLPCHQTLEAEELTAAYGRALEGWR